MKASLNWLKDFVYTPRDPRELQVTLRNLGLGVESITPSGDDWILDVEVTTNRPDCLNHYGIAREIATAYRRPLKKLEITLKEYGPPVSTEMAIDIQNPELCSRYCGRVIRNVEIKPSPEWLAARLQAIGLRPINNVADATNYVLMELGHPLHAFDLVQLRQHRILARRARQGETLRTLDGVDRKLTEENLVIADAERPVALAGVMGGQDSAITEATRSVLLESAWFDPLSIRRTAKAQGLHTEASHRFERGADIEMAPRALDRCTELILQVAGGEILRGIIDVYPQPRKRERVYLRRGEIQRILGAEISWEDVERILRSLGFIVERHGTEAWGVTPPFFRPDVTREVDLVEEVARHFGYDRLPVRLRPAPPRLERDLSREKELALASRLVSLGYREIITSSMVNPKENAQFSRLPSVVLENPLSQEASALRTAAAPSMLAALRWNLDREHEDLRFFEEGKIYWRPEGEPPQERRILTLGLCGARRPASVHEAAREITFFDLKGDLEAVFNLFDLTNLRFCSQGGDYYENGLRGEYQAGGEKLAAFGQLSSNFLREYKLRRAAWLAEIDLDRLLEFPLRPKSFRIYSKFPAVARDFSLMIPPAITYGDIEETFGTLDIEDVAGFQPVDLLRDGSPEACPYSLLLRVTFQSLSHTLSGDEVNAASQKILDALAPLGIHLRSGAQDKS